MLVLRIFGVKIEASAYECCWTTSLVQFPQKEVIIPFWEAIMTNNVPISPGVETPAAVVDDLWLPVTAAEIKKALPASTTSAGPDGLSARFLRKV